MANVTVSVPDELKARMDRQKTINWSAVARAEFEQKLAFAEELDRIMAKPDQKDEDFVELGRILNRKVNERWREDIALKQGRQKKGQASTAANAARRGR